MMSSRLMRCCSATTSLCWEDKSCILVTTLCVTLFAIFACFASMENTAFLKDALKEMMWNFPMVWATATSLSAAFTKSDCDYILVPMDFRYPMTVSPIESVESARLYNGGQL